MTRPLVQIYNVETGEDIVREMTDVEFTEYQARPAVIDPTPTKEQLLAELQALTSKINALG
jgi:hypothetical protein